MLKVLIISLLFFVTLNGDKIKANEWKDASASFHKARKGGEKDVIASLEIFKKMEKSAIRDAHIGSLTTMLAKYTYLPWKKMDYVKDGSKLLDTSLRIEPNNLEVRFLRFFTYIKLPDMLKKESFLQEDARYFIKLYKAQKQKETINNKLLDAIVQFYHKYENKEKRDKYLSYITDEKLKEKLVKKIAG